jgi:dynactin complex subunit
MFKVCIEEFDEKLNKVHQEKKEQEKKLLRHTARELADLLDEEDRTI